MPALWRLVVCGLVREVNSIVAGGVLYDIAGGGFGVADADLLEVVHGSAEGQCDGLVCRIHTGAGDGDGGAAGTGAGYGKTGVARQGDRVQAIGFGVAEDQLGAVGLGGGSTGTDRRRRCGVRCLVVHGLVCEVGRVVADGVLHDIAGGGLGVADADLLEVFHGTAEGQRDGLVYRIHAGAAAGDGGATGAGAGHGKTGVARQGGGVQAIGFGVAEHQLRAIDLGGGSAGGDQRRWCGVRRLGIQGVVGEVNSVVAGGVLHDIAGGGLGVADTHLLEVVHGTAERQRDGLVCCIDAGAVDGDGGAAGAGAGHGKAGVARQGGRIQAIGFGVADLQLRAVDLGGGSAGGDQHGGCAVRVGHGLVREVGYVVAGCVLYGRGVVAGRFAVGDAHHRLIVAHGG